MQACGREQECIDLYKVLEQQHPSAKIKRQAEQLRFIMEAPRLKLRPDERVSVPVLEAGGRFVCAASPSCLAPQVPSPVFERGYLPQCIPQAACQCLCL